MPGVTASQLLRFEVSSFFGDQATAEELHPILHYLAFPRAHLNFELTDDSPDLDVPPPVERIALWIVFPAVFAGNFPNSRSARFRRWVGRTSRMAISLAAASGKFDVLLTTDRPLRYWRKVSDYSIAVVVLVASRNKLVSLVPLVPELKKVLSEIKQGEVREVGVQSP